jgi:hypothetical protein
LAAPGDRRAAADLPRLVPRVVEFLRDLLGLLVSVGYVHDVLQAATRQASAVNAEQDLSGIRVGLHDEIFQGATPVLAGVDARAVRFSVRDYIW